MDKFAWTFLAECEAAEARELGIPGWKYEQLKQGFLTEIERLSQGPPVTTYEGEQGRRFRAVSIRNTRRARKIHELRMNERKKG